jgi:hypothetical protein
VSLLRSILGVTARAICSRVAPLFPARVIERDNGDPYLERYYVCGRAPAYFPVPVKERLAFLPTVFLHRFVRSDQDRELHNHPWDHSTSFILAGGYREERRWAIFENDEDFDCFEVHEHTFRPGDLNRISCDDFHRVDLLEHDAWTIFITGTKKQSWGFWDRDTGEFIPWREHLARRQNAGANVPLGEDDRNTRAA